MVWEQKTAKSETSFVQRAVKPHREYTGENKKKESLCNFF